MNGTVEEWESACADSQARSTARRQRAVERARSLRLANLLLVLLLTVIAAYLLLVP